MIVTKPGNYYCKVTNSAVDDLTLQSDAIYVDACSLKLSHDFLELVNLYNATNGDKWNNSWDLSQPVSTWSGVSLTNDGCSVKSIDLSDKGLSGQIPNLNLPNLQKLNLSNNQLSGRVPDFNNLYTLDISNNNFTFQGVTSSINISTFKYSPQNNIPITSEGDTLYVDAGGKIENNTYYWYKDSAKYKTIVGDSLLIATESGRYYCEVTNSAVDNLILQSDYINICSLKHDSLELVNLYNATNGDKWNNSWDLSQPVSTWYGVSLTDDSCSVKSIDLSDKGLSGQIPNLDLPNLQKLNLSNNQLSGRVPDFNDLESLDTLDIRNNNFTFQGVTSSINISTFEYSPQNNIPITSEGDTLYVDAGGKLENNTYYWYKDDVEYKTIVGDSLLIATESGRYYCEVTNSAVDDLTLQSDYIDVCSLKHDSLELVNLYNATNGDKWNNSWDLSQPVSTWSGVSLTNDGCSVKSIDLSDKGLSGQIPNLNLPNLQKLNLSNNQLSGRVPDFNNLYTLDIRNNNFTFQGVTSSINISTFEYSPQNNIPITSEGDTLYVDAGGKLENNTYYWYKDSAEYKTIVGDSLLIATESGRYYCEVTNSVVDDLTLQSDYIDVCSLKHDSLELVNLYNATKGGEWKIKWDLTKPVYTWYGVSLTDDGCSVKSIDLSDKGLSGQIPNLNLPNLQKLNLSNNQLSGTIPDFNNLDTLDIRNNNFTFQGVTSSINISTFKYSQQNNIPITSERDTLYVDAGGKLENNTYYWYKDDVEYKTIVGDSLLIATESG